MLIYNTSYLVEETLEESFCEWMKTKFIPLLQETKTFNSSHFCKVMVEKEAGGLTYSLQLLFKNPEFLEKYRSDFEPRINAIFQAKFRNKIPSFTSLLKEV